MSPETNAAIGREGIFSECFCFFGWLNKKKKDTGANSKKSLCI